MPAQPDLTADRGTVSDIRGDGALFLQTADQHAVADGRCFVGIGEDVAGALSEHRHADFRVKHWQRPVPVQFKVRHHGGVRVRLSEEQVTLTVRTRRLTILQAEVIDAGELQAAGGEQAEGVLAGCLPDQAGVETGLVDGVAVVGG
jgi:hypothetical protein